MINEQSVGKTRLTEASQSCEKTKTTLFLSWHTEVSNKPITFTFAAKLACSEWL